MESRAVPSTELCAGGQLNPFWPHEDESLPGWLLRVNEDASADVPRLADGRRRGRHGVEPLHQHVRRLAASAAVPVDVLERIALRPIGRRAWYKAFAEQHVRRAMVGFSLPKVCPACLVEETYARQWWDLKFYTDCTRHRVELINACPSCATPISWIRTTVGRCDQCGAHYRDGQEIPSDEHVVRVLSDFERVASGGTSQLVPAITTAIESAYWLQAAMETCLFIGRDVLRHWNMATAITPTSDVTDMRRLVRAAGVVLDGGWPSTYHQFLQAICVVPSHGKRPDLHAMFPGFYRQLFLRPRDDVDSKNLLGPLQDEFWAYVSKNYGDIADQIPGATKAVKRGERGRNSIPVTVAQKDLGLTGRTFHALVDALNISIINVGWGKGTRHVSRSDVSRMRAELARNPKIVYGDDVLQLVGQAVHTPRSKAIRRSLRPYVRFYEQFVRGSDMPSMTASGGLDESLQMPASMIARRWNITRNCVERIIKEGVFKTSLRSSTGLIAENVSIGAYAAFESALFERVKRRPSGVSDGMVAFPAATRVGAMARSGVRLGTLLKAAIDGELGPLYVNRDVRGLARIEVTRSQLEAFAARRRSQLLGSYYNSEQARRQLGTDSEGALRHLRVEKLLNPIWDPATGRYLYSPTEIAAIGTRFVRPQDISDQRLLPISDRFVPNIVKVLKALGVRPVMGPGIDRCPLVYYERAAVEAASRRPDIVRTLERVRVNRAPTASQRR